MRLGIFDSGLGGLTGYRALRKLLPHDDIVYFGDTARVPYGTRSKEVICRYAMQDVRFLLTMEVEAVLVACGTVSSNVLAELQEAFPLPFVGVVEPAAKKAVLKPKKPSPQKQKHLWKQKKSTGTACPTMSAVS